MQAAFVALRFLIRKTGKTRFKKKNPLLGGRGEKRRRRKKKGRKRALSSDIGPPNLRADGQLCSSLTTRCLGARRKKKKGRKRVLAVGQWTS